MNLNHSAYYLIKVALFAILSFMAIAGYSQKGTGEDKGVSREQINPELLRMEGTVEKIELAPCEDTTGKSVSETHLMVRTNEDLINVHLGPTAEVSKLISTKEGDQITMALFQTDKLFKDDYIAKAVIVNGEIVMLRDDDLKPVWAGNKPKEKVRKGEKKKLLGQNISKNKKP